MTTAFAVFATLPAAHAVAEPAQLIAEQHFSQDGYEVDLYVTEDGEGNVLTESTLTDPVHGDIVDMWTDGEIVEWHGTIGGEPVAGSMASIDLDPQAAPICFTPVTAILCLGAVILVFGSSCSGRNAGPCPLDPVDPSSGIPGGAGGVPDNGGDGDGDSGDDGKSGGGDED